MTKTLFKVAKPGFNADTDTNPDHFALYVDSSDTNTYTLIKEKLNASVSVPANTTTNISHGLGYVPFALVFNQVSGGGYIKSYGEPVDGRGVWYQVTSSQLQLINTTGSAVTFQYHIFFDLVI